jgi:hypothetical protein
MKKRLLFFLFISISLFTTSLKANEGMWLPILLQQLNEAEMQGLGMKMTAEDIYSINKGSLKDAIIRFGGGCTGSMISNEGLLLTNYHCGDGWVQKHSSLDNNYIEKGFWSGNRTEEIPNPGLEVTFVVRMEDVTAKALTGLTATMTEEEREAKIQENIAAITASTEKEDYEDVMVRPFFKGNAYYSFVTVSYKDVRLVAAPPVYVGSFGVDTDNWVWPRHSGDFSLFRVYADKDNKPAEYSEDNVPFRPKHFLPISLDGVAKDDFTLVMGFPGTTDEYLPASGVQQILEVIDPTRVRIRDRSLAIIDAAMRQDEQTRIQYLSHQSGIANGWKKWKGRISGLRATNGVERKEEFEELFQETVMSNPDLRDRYGDLLSDFKEQYREIEPYTKARLYYIELLALNIQAFPHAGRFNRLLDDYDPEDQTMPPSNRIDEIKKQCESFFENYRADIDQKVFASQMAGLYNELEKEYLPQAFLDLAANQNEDFEKMAAEVYSSSVITDPDKLMPLLEGDPAQLMSALAMDPMIALRNAMVQKYVLEINAQYQEMNTDIERMQRTYINGLMEAFPKKRFFPDANGTLRVSYGKVAGYEGRDAIIYKHQTYLSGIMEKYIPGDYEFDVPEKLRRLYQTKDYGQYGDQGRMPVCFVGTNHTSGGNSGSPAIDGEGNLIGLNFDRVWEGTMSDVYYDPSICRNIMVDIRYVLFMVDKFGGSNHLIKEMKLVHPKK